MKWIVDRHGLPRYTENTITDEAELAAIRDRGYSIDDEERITKQIAVGAPVLDRTRGSSARSAFRGRHTGCRRSDTER